MNKDFLQHSPRSCVTYSAPSPTCQSSRGQLDSTARKVTQDRAEPTVPRAWQARMGNEVTLDHADRRGKTDEMVLTEKRVLQVMKALSDPCQSTSGEGQNSGSSRPKRSGVRGLIYAARAATASAWLVLAVERLQAASLRLRLPAIPRWVTPLPTRSTWAMAGSSRMRAGMLGLVVHQPQN